MITPITKTPLNSHILKLKSVNEERCGVYVNPINNMFATVWSIADKPKTRDKTFIRLTGTYLKFAVNPMLYSNFNLMLKVFCEYHSKRNL